MERTSELSKSTIQWQERWKRFNKVFVGCCLSYKTIRYTLREKKARFSCQIIRFVAPNLMNSSAVVRFNKWQVTVALRDAEVLVKKEEC